MTIALTIATPFADFSELAENFAQRVDAERLMLPYAEPVPEGEWVSFTVTYADGSTALAGAGRCQGSYDNGEEHPPEYRFDVVVESLQIEGAGEVMFERLVMARNSQLGEPATGEVSIGELEAKQAEESAVAAHSVSALEDNVEEAVEEAHEEAVEEEHVGGGWDEPMPTAIANLESLAASSVRSEPPPAPAYQEKASHQERAAPPAEKPRAAPPPAAAGPSGVRGAAARPRPGRASAPVALPSPHTFNGTVLTRPTQPAAWSPEPAERPEAASSTGLFDYGRGGLPKPARPPRPELAAEARVELAPGPGRPARRVAPASTAAAGPQTVPPADEDLDEDAAPFEATSQYDLPEDDAEA